MLDFLQNNQLSSWQKWVFISIVLLIVCLPAIQPFTLGRLHLSADGVLHLYRTVALDHSIQVDGVLYPRYSSGLVYGYGAPLWNYFPPTAHYPALILHRFGASYQTAFLWAFALYTFIAASGAFLLGSRWGEFTAGFITSAAYVYAPYFLFNTISRGTLTETAALAILPWALWGFTRLAHNAKRLNWVLAILLYVLFIMMHNIITLHGTALLGLYSLFLVLSAKQKPAVFSRLFLVGAFSLGITTFFWMPALLETDFVRIDGVTQNLSTVDVTTHLRPLVDVFALPFTADVSRQGQPVPISLGWIQLILSAAGLSFLLREKGIRRNLVMLILVLLAGLIFLNTPASAWIWRTIPLIGYTQFAWRVLGIASLLLALLAGLAVHVILKQLPSTRYRQLLIAFSSTIIILWHTPWLYTLYLDGHNPQSISDAQNYERETGQLALSSFSEYLPIWTETVPDAEKLIAQFEENPTISRLHPNDALEIISAEWGGTQVNLDLEVDENTKLIFDWLFFPGWQAEISGAQAQVLDVRPTSPEGLVSLEIPAGRYQLSLSLQPTATQQLAQLISAIALVSSGLWIIIGLRFFQTALAPIATAQAQSFVTLQQTGAILISVGLGIFLLKALVLDHTNNPVRTQRMIEGQLPNLPIQQNANFNNEILLLGAESVDSASTGSTVNIKLYWELIDQPIEADYSSIVQLTDTNGLVVAESSSFTPGNLATSEWLTGYYVVDTLKLNIPADLPPTTHTLNIGLFVPESGARLNVVNIVGNPEGIEVRIGDIQVSRDDVTPIADGLSLADIHFHSLAHLPDTVTVGDELLVEWVWRGQTNEIYQARLAWLEDNTVASYSTSVPIVTDYPTNQWDGDAVRGHHRLYVPADLTAGTYDIAVQLLVEDGETIIGETDSLQTMQVGIPERSFELPEMMFTAAQQWSNGIELIGYDIINDINGQNLKLHWRTSQPLRQSLRLFVHILAGEQIVAQSDGVPLDWTRPTTSWIKEEILTTTHEFDVTEGNYVIRVGWYNPITGERVELGDGGDLFDLPDNLSK